MGERPDVVHERLREEERLRRFVAECHHEAFVLCTDVRTRPKTVGVGRETNMLASAPPGTPAADESKG